MLCIQGRRARLCVSFVILSGRRYVRHRPEATVLYDVVERHQGVLFAHLEGQVRVRLCVPLITHRFSGDEATSRLQLLKHSR